MVAAVRKHIIFFALLALVGSVLLTRGLSAQPGYTDAYYYFNAAERLAAGDGLTDGYLYTYNGAPETIAPDEAAPSHLYWMPLTSLVAGFGMWVLDAPGDYYAAQWPLAVMLAAVAGVGFWLGGRIGGTRRHMWVAGIMTLAGGFYARFWGQTDNFIPYALVGSLALAFIGLGATAHKPRWWLLAGICAGLSHLTRVDGVLLLLVAWLVILLDRRSLTALALVTTGYLLAMGPWFVRNLIEIGTPLPLGGAQAMWYLSYDDLFNYPPGASLGDFTAQAFIDSRWTAFVSNLQTFIAVEGLIVLAPLLLLALWNRRREPFLRGVLWYALGLHILMTLIFPFAGYRGGLLHSSVALFPWWMALGVAGLDDLVDWIAVRRRTWNPRSAKWVFSVGLVALALVLSWNIAVPNRVEESTPGLYQRVRDVLPDDARVVVNDPPEFYYHTGLSALVLPNAPVETLLDLAENYHATHVLIQGTAVPVSFDLDTNNPPDFLTPVDVAGGTLYAIAR